MNHPIQPIERDDRGALHFKENAIVRYLFDHGDISLGDLAVMPYSNEDRVQFVQLIGYSLGGFSELSYVSDDLYKTAKRMAETGDTEDQSRIAVLEEELTALREALREPIARLYGVHPDRLERNP
ncbi:MAG: hypothetical protein AB7G11_02305 [Phycisphaerales bacterium]